MNGGNKAKKKEEKKWGSVRSGCKYSYQLQRVLSAAFQASSATTGKGKFKKCVSARHCFSLQRFRPRLPPPGCVSNMFLVEVVSEEGRKRAVVAKSL